MMLKKDLVNSGVIGFIIAVILLGISKNISIEVPNLWMALFVFPVLSVIGIFIASLLAKKFAVLLQAARFFLVGGLNTFIDLGILNLLIFVGGTAVGIWFSVFKGIAFVVAVLNSYVWNKYWTFNVKTRRQGKEFVQFLLVSIVGFIINVGVASFFVNVVGAPDTISENIWANVSAGIATLTAMLWNFMGYKLIVFKK
ncbi:MAG TPA: GtrA family protein [candidate division CPR3 bacterium]|uniref:GtrA family protein n=1 Tax=candidate division CPR3 bacterium TaxID=2268181 RepID=A0A7C1T7G6_UNCC3|nr:GtrA family protein [candidate division CPR3 bacterium]